MKDILIKLNLIENLTTEIHIQKNDFIKKLRDIVDAGDTSFFSDPYDVLSSSKNDYKGHVGLNEFEIKRRSRFFDMNMNLAVAKGDFKQKGDQLMIDTEINGFGGMVGLFFIFLIIIYISVIISFLISDKKEDSIDVLIIVHAVFMFGIPYIMMRRSVNRMKHELEYIFDKMKTPYNNKYT